MGRAGGSWSVQAMGRKSANPYGIRDGVNPFRASQVCKPAARVGKIFYPKISRGASGMFLYKRQGCENWQKESMLMFSL